MDGKIDGWMYRRIDIDKKPDRQVDGRTGGRTDGTIDRRMDGRIAAQSVCRLTITARNIGYDDPARRQWSRQTVDPRRQTIATATVNDLENV